MDFAFTEEEEAFRQEVKEWLKKEIPTRWYELSPGLFEENEETWDIARQFEQRLADNGWYAPSYPTEYGGVNATFMQQCILSEEKALLRAPTTMSQLFAVGIVGPTLMLYGSEEQKKKYLRGIGTAELVFCLGYSEPTSGSDLAALQTRAMEDGDDLVINGQKIFTTLAHRADYCWLAVKTDPDAPRHRGISMLIVDMKTPGIAVRPLMNIVGSHEFNEVFFDNVRVPKTALVGEKNRGWHYAMTALSYERSGITGPAFMHTLIGDLAKYAKETTSDGRALSDDPLVQQKLAAMATDVEVSRLLCYRVADLESRGGIPTYEASVSMVFASELARRIAKLGGEILGLYGQLTRDSKRAPLRGAIEVLYLSTLVLGIAGGTNEIQRNVIALLGLGLPRG